jgi:hypothetical protein
MASAGRSIGAGLQPGVGWNRRYDPMKSMHLVAVSIGDWLSDLSVEIVGAVLGTIIFAGVSVVAYAIWRRRRSPLDLVDKGEQALADRARRIERARHDELVQHVLDRAAALGIELPTHIAGRNPAIVTLHSSGTKHARYPDLPSYKAAVERGDVSPIRASFGKPPLVVSRWSDDRLRDWLREHAQDLPPTKRAA